MELRDVEESYVWIDALRFHVKRLKRLKRLHTVSTKEGTLSKNSLPALRRIWKCARDEDSRLEDVEIEWKGSSDESLHLEALSETEFSYSVVRKF